MYLETKPPEVGELIYEEAKERFNIKSKDSKNINELIEHDDYQ